MYNVVYALCFNTCFHGDVVLLFFILTFMSIYKLKNIFNFNKGKMYLHNFTYRNQVFVVIVILLLRVFIVLFLTLTIVILRVFI